MIILSDTYANVIAPSVNYPYGEIKNSDPPTALNGTPLEKAVYSDLIGWQQAAVEAAGITPSGNPETARASQVLQAVINHRWYAHLDYATGTEVVGSDGMKYSALQPSGPSTAAVDPVTETAPRGYWQPLGSSRFRDVGTGSGNVAEYTANGLSGFGYGGMGTNIGDWTSLSQTQFVMKDTDAPATGTHYGFKVVADPNAIGALWAARNDSYWKSESGGGPWKRYWDDSNLPNPAVTNASNTFNGNQTIGGNLVLNSGTNKDVFLKLAESPESGGAQGFELRYLGAGSNDTVFGTKVDEPSFQEFMRIARGSSTVTFAGSVYAANYHPVSSDQRLKNKLRPVVINYRQAAALQSWVFRWKDIEAVPESQRGKTEIGLMAQDILKVFPPEQYPSLVIKKDNGYYTIDPDKILMMRVFAKVEPRIVTWCKDAKGWINGLLSS